MAFDFNSFQNSTSIAQQTTSSVTSTVKNLTSAINTGVTGALNSVSSALGLSGLSGAGSVKGAFNALGSTNIVAELKDTLGVASVIGSILPEMVPNGSAPPISMTYPNDLGKYYIQLFFFDYYQQTAITQRTSKDNFIVSLPIPENLQEQFNMSYADKHLGAFGLLEEIGLNNQSLSALMSGTTKQARQVAEGMGQTGGDLLAQGGGGPAGLYLARSAINGISDNAGNLVDRVTGSVLNPYQQLQFEGVGLREHTFSYTFSPNSKVEADTLRDIIRQLKMRMHPEMNGMMLNFPDQCKIKLSGGLNDLAYYTFQDCYLKNMAVNYAPSGTPSFFKDGTHPVEIKLDLTFGEIRPITRDFYTKGDGAGVPQEMTSPFGTTEAATIIPSILKSK